MIWFGVLMVAFAVGFYVFLCLLHGRPPRRYWPPLNDPDKWPDEEPRR